MEIKNAEFDSDFKFVWNLQVINGKWMEKLSFFTFITL